MSSMISKLCPDCWTSIDSESKKCVACGWQVGAKDEVEEYLATLDRKSGEFEAYLDNYDSIAGDDLSTSIQDAYYLDLQIRNFKRYVGSVRDKWVCDVGVGQGLLIQKMLEDVPKHIVGIDISVAYLKRLAQLCNVELIVANAERLPFRSQFDVLTAADVLEHVFNPSDFLVSVNRALKVGGKFVVKVPYRENLVQYSRLLGCPYRFVHLRSFDRAILVDLLMYSGFEVEKVYYDGFLPVRVRDYIKNSSWLSEKFDNWVKGLESPFQAGEINHFLARMIMRPLEITVVARKVRDIVLPDGK